jgi:hypothetical protein
MNISTRPWTGTGSLGNITCEDEDEEEKKGNRKDASGNEAGS